MSIDKKTFGISDSLVNAVNEALKGSQHKIDVAEPKGKITGADFKKLRGEGAKPDFLDLDKDGNEKESMKKAIKDKNVKEQTPGDFEKANFKHKMMKEDQVDEGNPANKAKKNAAAAAVGASNRDAQHLGSRGMKTSVADKIRGREKMSGNDRKQFEETVVEAAPAASGVADQMAARKDALQSQIQRKIAQKQMDVMKSKANKRISNIKETDSKCSCGTTNESKMKCEVHGGKDKATKGGREAIVMNPPLKEASNLPKKVVTKGHEIAKSLIKHKSKVDNPYAVGMAAAKKSAGVKEEAEQVDELSKKTLYRYGHKAHDQIVRTNAIGVAKRTGGVGMKNAALKLKNRKAGSELAFKKAQAKKD